MRLDLYQAETARIATEQSALLAQAKQRLADGLALSPLEQSGVLHALQILIENAIGKAKQRYLLVSASAVGAASAAMRAVARKGGTARPWRAFSLCALRRIAAEAAPTAAPCNDSMAMTAWTCHTAHAYP